jgi:hypothetical protein
MVLWCNLHGGFVIGLFFAGRLAAEAVLEAPAAGRMRAIAGWGGFLACATLAALASPNGFAALLLPFKMLGMNFALASISEWHSPDFARFDPLEAWIALAILAGFTLGIRLPPSRILMVLLLLWMALVHVRNKELLGIIAPLLLAAPLAKRLGSERAAAEPSPEARGRPRVGAGFAASAALAVVTILGFFGGAWALDRSGVAPRGDIAPAAALAAAHRAGLGRHVFNSVRFGGFLMFTGVPTFVDGRADLFGDAFLQRYAAASTAMGNWLPELLDRYAIAWTMLEPSSPAAGLLPHLPGWERVYADPFAVIDRRTVPPPGGLAR